MIAKCNLCGCDFNKSAGHLNRAMKLGVNVFCSKQHFYESRRIQRSDEEKKRIKTEYDDKYRRLEKVKIKKAEYFKKDYAKNPDKYKKERQRRYTAHLKYLQTDGYKKWKADYDKKYLAKKHFGEFAEAAIILTEIEKIIDSKKVKYENGITINKSSQKRQRKWQQQLKN